MIRDFNQLYRKANEKKGIVIGVAYPEEDHTIHTILEARNLGLADFILSGKKSKIIELIEKNSGHVSDFDVIDCDSKESSVLKIVDLARENKAHILMKGDLPTAMVMKPILDKKNNLSSGKFPSNTFVSENPLDNVNELIGLADGGLNILPNLEQKVSIVKNAVDVFHKLGYNKPKVGIMAAIETVEETMPATVDARELTRLNDEGVITGCDVYGPLALDIAVSPEAARKKGVDHPVAGHVQIIIVPNIETGNIFAKSFVYYLDLPVSNVVTGGKIPVLTPSRSESNSNRLNSVALGVMVAEI